MPFSKNKDVLFPSLLDWLTDEDVKSLDEATVTPHEIVEHLVDSIMGDLELMLNTRSRSVAWPGGCEQLERSLLSYGLADFSRRDLATDFERDGLRQEIESLIRHHEPRLQGVGVELLPTDPLSSVVRFRVRARVGEMPEFVNFDIRGEVRDAIVQLQVTGAGQ